MILILEHNRGSAILEAGTGHHFKGGSVAKAVSVSDFLKLSISKRIRLVEDVWDSITYVPEAVPVTDR